MVIYIGDDDDLVKVVAMEHREEYRTKGCQAVRLKGLDCLRSWRGASTNSDPGLLGA